MEYVQFLTVITVLMVLCVQVYAADTSQCDGKWWQNERDDCYYQLASRLKDPVVCYRIQRSCLKDDCLNEARGNRGTDGNCWAEMEQNGGGICIVLENVFLLVSCIIGALFFAANIVRLAWRKKITLKSMGKWTLISIVLTIATNAALKLIIFWWGKCYDF
jgi:hypothetical protein